MANKEIRRADALTLAITAVSMVDADELEVTEEVYDSAITVLTKMYDQVVAKRNANGEKSDAYKHNKEIAEKLVKILPAGEVLTSKIIRENYDPGFEVGSRGKVEANHVNAVLKVAADEGLLTKTKVGDTYIYTKA